MAEAERSLQLAKQVKDIGFTEFTADLISSTFETLTSSALTQLKAYGDLVTSVSKTLAEYTQDTLGVDDPTGDDAGAKKVRDEWIRENLLDPGLATQPNPGDDLTAQAADKPQLVQIFSGITAASGDDFDKALGAEAAGVHTVTEALLHEFVGQKLQGDVKVEQDLLVTILELGMQKLVVTDGKIKTKLTFNTWASESRSKSSTSVSTHSRGFSVGGRFLGSVFRAAGSYGSRKMSVNVVNEHSSAVLSTTTEMIGEVLVCFKTETFDRIEAPA